MNTAASSQLMVGSSCCEQVTATDLMLLISGMGGAPPEAVDRFLLTAYGIGNQTVLTFPDKRQAARVPGALVTTMHRWALVVSSACAALFSSFCRSCLQACAHHRLAEVMTHNRYFMIEQPASNLQIMFRFAGHVNLTENFMGIATFAHPDFQQELR